MHQQTVCANKATLCHPFLSVTLDDPNEISSPCISRLSVYLQSSISQCLHTTSFNYRCIIVIHSDLSVWMMYVRRVMRGRRAVYDSLHVARVLVAGRGRCVFASLLRFKSERFQPIRNTNCRFPHVLSSLPNITFPKLSFKVTDNSRWQTHG